MFPALMIEHLTKIYANNVVALQNIDLIVQTGDFFGLLGPNGAGKTTTIDILVSLVRKTSGSVHVFGYDLDQQLNQVKACIGLVPQEFNMNNFEKNINILINQAGYYGIPRKISKERGEYYLNKLGLYHKRFETPRQLSGGMKRRLMIARALVHEPQLLILDEPTAGVDVELRHLIWDFLQELNQKGRTLILTTHYLEEAEKLCNRIAFIDQGCIIHEDTTANLLQNISEELFILDLIEPINCLLQHPDFIFTPLSDKQIQVTRKNGRPLNALFAYLTQNHIQILSIRTAKNRLETLFLKLINKENA